MRIKNWNEFQHFKDRRPPWIKLHRDILEKRDINMISDCAFRVLVGLWLLASEDKAMQGTIPSADIISFRLRIEKPKVIKALKELDTFMIHDDIKAISERYQVDVPETETETEIKTEKEVETETDSFLNAWLRYPKREGGNPKAKANKAWDARIRDGCCPKEMTDGLNVYRRYCDAKGIIGTSYVLQAATFFGPDRRWEEDWSPPQPVMSNAERQRKDALNKVLGESNMSEKIINGEVIYD